MIQTTVSLQYVPCQVHYFHSVIPFLLNILIRCIIYFSIVSNILSSNTSDVPKVLSELYLVVLSKDIFRGYYAPFKRTIFYIENGANIISLYFFRLKVHSL